MINCLQTNKLLLSNRKQDLSVRCSNALRELFSEQTASKDAIVPEEYELTLLSTLYRLEQDDDIKQSVRPYIVKKYKEFNRFDYFDLLFAISAFPDIEELFAQKSNMWKKIMSEQTQLCDYFFVNEYGVGALGLLNKTNKTDLQIPAEFYIIAKERLLKTLCDSDDYHSIDIAIYSLSKSDGCLNLSRKQIDMAIQAIVVHQNENGSWGGEYGFFTPFALRILLGSDIRTKCVNCAIEHGVEFMLSSEKYYPNINSVAMIQELLCDMDKGDIACRL